MVVFRCVGVRGLESWRSAQGRFLKTAALSLSAWLCAATVQALEGPRGSSSETGAAASLVLPYQAAGLTEREAAAHLLDRFGFGARPGEVDDVVEKGLASWIEVQLAESNSDLALAPRLKSLDALALSPTELQTQFVDPGRLARESMRKTQRQSGKTNGDTESRSGIDPSDEQPDRRTMRREVMAEMRENGQRPHRVLMEQLFTNKVMRAVYSENQLAEVLTDFWFNHFNIDARKREARPYLFSYERDAIRPNVLGNFSDLLLATATHPAMLLYLDNARSRAESGQRTTADFVRKTAEAGRQSAGRGGRRGSRGPSRMAERRPQRVSGLNENYARELMELHTLGVDGGYSQEDVIEVARALTGWMVLPATGELRERFERRLPSQRLRSQLGFVEKDGFFFNAAFHDAENKTVLGQKLRSGRGMEDGLHVIELLGGHPSTARFVTHKLAQRFVSDQPSEELVDRLSAAFTSSGGEIAEVLLTMVRAPEFWESRRKEIKSPFELVISTVRAMEAEVWSPRSLGKWLEQLGQPLYRYQAPTGYPETSEFWVNTGGLLNRMNFGLEVAGGLLGVRVDLLGLLDGREPESSEEALRAFASVLLPERDPAPIVAALLPSLGIEGLGGEVARRMEPTAIEDDPNFVMEPVGETDGPEPGAKVVGSEALTRIMGLLVGSPEFQRR